MVQSNKAKKIKVAWARDAFGGDTPAKQALQEFLRPVKKPRERPTTTWLKKISNDLSETNIRLNPQNGTP